MNTTELILFCNLLNTHENKIHSYKITNQDWYIYFELSLWGKTSNLYTNIRWDIETVTKMINSL